MDRKNFEKAFDACIGSRWATCACGREFINSSGGWDWSDVCLDKLHADPNVTDLDWAVGFVSFEGQEFVMDCDCWHKRADQIMKFLDSHFNAISAYLVAEKKRLLDQANSLVTPEI